MEEDATEARRLIVCLAELLRDALEDSADEQTLAEEVAWLQRYAEILEARHRGCLRFRWEIVPEARGLLLPRFLLQPLVENAVKHGALRRREGGEVAVRATGTGDGAVICVIEDNGPGMGATVGEDSSRSSRFGLRSVQRRLALERPGATLQVESSEQGTRVVIAFPASRNDS